MDGESMMDHRDFSDFFELGTFQYRTSLNRVGDNNFITVRIMTVVAQLSFRPHGYWKKIGNWILRFPTPCPLPTVRSNNLFKPRIGQPTCPEPVMQGSTEIEVSTRPGTNGSHRTQFVGNGALVTQINGKGIIALGISNHRGNECLTIIAQISQAGKFLYPFRFLSGVIRTLGHRVGLGLVKFYIQL